MYFNLEAISKILETEDPQIVAQEFTDVLNEALKQKKAREEEAAKKAKKAKLEDAKKLEKMIFDYVQKYYPEVSDYIGNFSDKDAEIFMDAIDELCQEMKDAAKVVIKNVDTDALSKFLKENGLK